MLALDLSVINSASLLVWKLLHDFESKALYLTFPPKFILAVHVIFYDLVSSPVHAHVHAIYDTEQNVRAAIHSGVFIFVRSTMFT